MSLTTRQTRSFCFLTAMGVQEQSETLLPHGTATKQDALRAVVQDGTNSWRGPLLGCCSGCDSDAWGSCLLGYFLPCVAFGHNMKRALNLSAWSQALVFLVLFLVGRWLVAWSYAAVKVSCPRQPPPHERKAYHVAGCLGHECLGLDILVKAATPLPGSFSDSNSAFDGYHQQHHSHTVTPECHQALAALGATYCVMVVLAIIGVVYAAQRRTQLREKFGITGSRLGDFCTWCWCAPCALCQETRTMFSNNVQNGVWHGQTPPVIAASAYSVPEVEDMKVDYAPVHAKDFV